MAGEATTDVALSRDIVSDSARTILWESMPKLKAEWDRITDDFQRCVHRNRENDRTVEGCASHVRMLQEENQRLRREFRRATDCEEHLMRCNDLSPRVAERLGSTMDYDDSIVASTSSSATADSPTEPLSQAANLPAMGQSLRW